MPILHVLHTLLFPRATYLYMADKVAGRGTTWLLAILQIRALVQNEEAALLCQEMNAASLSVYEIPTWVPWMQRAQNSENQNKAVAIVWLAAGASSSFPKIHFYLATFTTFFWETVVQVLS